MINMMNDVDIHPENVMKKVAAGVIALKDVPRLQANIILLKVHIIVNETTTDVALALHHTHPIHTHQVLKVGIIGSIEKAATSIVGIVEADLLVKDHPGTNQPPN